MNSLELGIELPAVSTPIYSMLKPHQVQVLDSLIIQKVTASGGESRPKEIRDLDIGHILAPRIARLRTVLSGIGFEKCTALWGSAGGYCQTDACPQISGFITVVRNDLEWAPLFIYCQDDEPLIEQRRSHEEVVYAHV